MPVPLDECLPWRLRHEIVDLDVRTTQFMGWAGLANGELIRRMHVAKISAFVTIDGNVEFQQNTRDSGIGVVVLKAQSNRYRDVAPLIPQIRSALGRIKPGEMIRIAQ